MTAELPARVEAVVVGGGHAGLAMSRVLGEHGIDHVVLERGRLAERWRSERWDSLRLLTPNWATGLPGRPYAGPDPDGFMDHDEVARYLEDYAASFAAPVVTGVAVHAVEPAAAPDRYLVRTSAGTVEAHSVVAATGPFQLPHVPDVAAQLPPDIVQVHSSTYRRHEALPPGGVLVVGTGASGQQIADELVAAGRPVHVSVGRHRRVPRRYRGRDYFWWLERGGFYAKTADEVPEEVRRGGASPAITGARGGRHDLDLRRLTTQGATLVGRVRGVEGARLILAPDLAASMEQGDRAHADFVQWVEERLDVVGEPVDDPEPFERLPDPPELADPPRALDLRASGIGSVVWATGFRPDFASWVRLPVLDPEGRPAHRRGVTDCPGFFFLGLHWLHRLRSAFIRGAEEDARHLGDHIAARAHGGTAVPAATRSLDG